MFDPALSTKKRGTLGRAMGLDVAIVDFNLADPTNFGFHGKSQLEIPGVVFKTLQRDVYGSIWDKLSQKKIYIKTPEFENSLTFTLGNIIMGRAK